MPVIEPGVVGDRGADAVRALPKANLHAHLTGSMRPSTLADLAARYGLPLPAPLDPAAAHGWGAFQARYDTARAAIRTAADVTRVVTEAVEDNLADGCGWLELQVDPTSYADRLGGAEAVVETVLAAMAGSPAGLIIAASWGADPEHAEALARLAARYAGSGPGPAGGASVGAGVVGFGLSNDERLGRVADFVPAFRIAAEAGLLAVPHAGFYEPAWHVRDCVRLLGAARIGHGVTAYRDPASLELLAGKGVTLEVCPTSYPPLGVIDRLGRIPVRELLAAGVPVALGSDDPLLFGVGIAGQYAIAERLLGCDATNLAAIARTSVLGSAAPVALRERLCRGIDDWLAGQ